MNERITELMIEAGKTIPGDKNIDADFCKNFAELIVRECASVLLEWKNEPFPFDEDTAARLIKDHFEIKQ